MDQCTALLWWHLNVLTKRRYDAVKEVYGDIASATKHLSEELLQGLGVREEVRRSALMRLESFDADRIAKAMEQKGITLITMEDDAYPAVLREIGDPPIFLSYRGDLSVLQQPLLALVGTRRMSQNGKRAVGEFVPAFVAAGVVTVSGLALGIDTAVARETLLAHGKTIAVLGNGLSRILPESNSDLADEILKTGGLILSEFPLDQPPDTYTFPARNRIIAGLTLGTVVFEAPEGSGALITAELANEYGRDVFAVPGSIFDPNAQGCNTFIARGQARLVLTPEDVLREIGIVTPAISGRTYHPGTEEEGRIWASLTTLPQTIDDIVEKTEISPAAIGSALTMMELVGAVKNVGGGGWVRQ